jgi:hypothetical protein
LPDKLKALNSGELMNLTNIVVDEEIQACILTHQNIKASRGHDKPKRVQNKAFEYKIEEKKKPETSGIGISRWEGGFDDSENSDFNVQDDWDYANKKTTSKKITSKAPPKASPQIETQKKSGFTYDDIEASDEQSSEGDEWGSFDLP